MDPVPSRLERTILALHGTEGRGWLDRLPALLRACAEALVAAPSAPLPDLRRWPGYCKEEIMWNALFWLYVVNAVLLIDHEIDSAYWKEWDLFGLKGGIGGFLLLHLPLLGAVLYGLVLVERRMVAGLILSLLLGVGGLFAFGIHTYFLRRGRAEFRAPISQSILYATLLVSLAQAVVTVVLLISG